MGNNKTRTQSLFVTVVIDLDILQGIALTLIEINLEEGMEEEEEVEMKEAVCVIVVTEWDILPGSAQTERGAIRGVEVLCATSAIEWDTLLVNVPKVMTTMEEDVIEIMSVVVDPSVTSVTGLVILPEIAMTKRTGATSATGPGTLPGTAAKRRTPATTATRPGTL